MSDKNQTATDRDVAQVHNSSSANHPMPVALSRVSWGSIFAGAVVALATMMLLTSLGVAIGASTIDPMRESNPLAGIPTGTGIFLVVAQLIALGVGGYTAARLAGIPRKTGSLLHGASVWAVATLAITYMATTSLGALVSGSASLFSSAASGVASASAAVIPDDFELPDMSLGAVDLDDLPQSMQDTLRKQGMTAENFREESREMLRSVVSRQEQQAVSDVAANTLEDVATSPMDALDDVNQMIDKLVGKGAVFSEEDKTEALAVMRNRFGLSEEDATQIYDRWMQQAQEAAEQTQQSLIAAKEKSIEVADAAASALSKLGFLVFLASLLGLAASVAGAHFGKPDSLIGDELSDHV